MKRLVIFGGTSEGRILAEGLANAEAELVLCVATDYGKACLPDVENLTVHTGRLNQEEIAAFLQETPADLVVDATHPYAAEVSANIRAACRVSGTSLCRLARPISDTSGCIWTSSLEEAADYLAFQTGNALLTTGSTHLDCFLKADGFRERYYVRVLPTADAIQTCLRLGFLQSHIIAMQGPFSSGLNDAMLREIKAEWLVTKDSGTAGGFPGKVEGARRAGARVIVAGRQPEPGSYSSTEELLERLQARYPSSGKGVSQ